MLTRVVVLSLVCLGVMGAPRAGWAQQGVSLSLGSLVLRGEDARVAGDVLNANRSFLTFDPGRFNGATVGGEWLVPLGSYLEAAAGVGFYRRTVPSVYADYVDQDGTEIEQDLRLRMVPVTGLVRVLLGGQRAAVQPYFGAGLSLVAWRYSESGEFVDFAAPGRPIFREQFVATGSDVGPVVVAGVRLGPGAWTAGGEVRYSKAEGTVGPSFASDTIDLGGWAYQATVGFRFR